MKFSDIQLTRELKMLWHGFHTDVVNRPKRWRFFYMKYCDMRFLMLQENGKL